MVTSTASGTTSYSYAFRTIKELEPGKPVPNLDDWKKETEESGAKAAVKSFFGSDRGDDLRAIDAQYGKWYATLSLPEDSIEQVRAAVILNTLLRRYIAKKKGLLQGDGNRKVDYFHLVEVYTRDAYIRLLANPNAQVLEMASAQQWAYEEYYLRPKVRRDVIQLIASIQVSNNWVADGLSLVSVAVVAGIQGSERNPSTDAVTTVARDADNSNALIGSVIKVGRQLTSAPQFSLGVDPSTQISSEEDLLELRNNPDYSGEFDESAVTAAIGVATTDQMRRETVAEGKSETLAERFTKVAQAIGKALKWLFDKMVELLRHVYDHIEDYLPVLKAIAKMCFVKCLKSCGLLVGAALDLAQNAMDLAKAVYKAISASVQRKKALPLTESMDVIHDAFISNAKTDIAINSVLTAASATSLAGQILSGGSSLLVSILTNTLSFFAKTAWKLYKLMKLKKFLEEVRLIYASAKCMGYGEAIADGVTKHHELGSVDYQNWSVGQSASGSALVSYRSVQFRAAPYLDHRVVFNENNSFQHLMYTACKCNLVLPSILMLSGISREPSGEAFLFYNSVEWVLADEQGRDGKVLAWNSEDPRRAHTYRYLETLRGQASEYLRNCGLLVRGETTPCAYDATREQGFAELLGSAFAASSVRGRSVAVA